MFSRRTEWKLAPNRFTQAQQDALALGREVLDLTISNPTRVNLRYDAEAILGSLIDEGLNIGNFSVSLQNRQSEMSNNGNENLNAATAIREVQTPVALSRNNIISIFI